LHGNIEHLSSGSDFDRRFGVSTSGKIPLSALNIDLDNKAAGMRYEPTAPSAFSEMMAAALPQKMFPRATFIDIGCGRGRVLLMAAEHGFRKIIGIDFARRPLPHCPWQYRTVSPLQQQLCRHQH